MMFWLSSGAESTSDARQKAFIDALRSGVRPDNAAREWPRGWSLIADAGVRKFIDAVVTKLRPQPTAAAALAPGDTPTDLHRARRDDGRRHAGSRSNMKEHICQHEKMEVFVSRTDLPSHRAEAVARESAPLV